MRRLHAAVLAAFAVTQPLFDIVARNPGLLVAHRPTRAETLLLTLLLSALPAGLALLLAEAARRAGARAADAAGWLLPALLAALVVLPPLGRTALPWPLVLLCAAGVGGAAAMCLRRYEAARLFLTALSPALVLFPILFLASGSIRPLLLSGLPAAAAPAAFTKGTGGLPPIVFVMFDEFPLISLLGRDRRIDASRFPNFAALSRESLWFRNAATVADDTLTALPALLTGRYPEGPRLPVWNDQPPSLFTLLAPAYEFDVHEANTLMCPPDLCRGSAGRPPLSRRLAGTLSDMTVVYLHLVLPGSLRSGLPSVTQDWKDFSGPRDSPRVEELDAELVRRTEDSLNERSEVFRGFIAGLAPRARPTLHFLHAMLPHPPFIYLPSGKTYSRRSYLPMNERVVTGLSEDGERWSQDPAAVRQAWQRHLLQVGFTDRLLGELLARLRDTGLYDQALLVFISDHGAGFEPGGHRRILSDRNAGSILPVPLFIKLPGQARGEVRDREAESVDVLPTIAGILGLRLDAPTDGRDLLGAGPGRRVRVFTDRQGRRRDIALTAAARDAALDARIRLFGAGDGWASLFRAGTRSALLGKRVSSIPACPPLDTDAEFDQDSLLRNPVPSVSPSFLSGRINSAAALRGFDTAAVAVNRTVLAVVPLKPDRGGAAFSALLPEDSFRGGDSAEVFVVSRDGGRLCPLRASGTGYSLAESTGSGAGFIADASGTRYALEEGRLRGHVERAFIAQDHLVLRGWALDPRAKRPPAAVLVFSGGRFILRGAAAMPRPRVAANLGDPALKDCGFEFAIPRELIGDLEKADVRVYALASDGAASELTYWRP